MATFGILGQHYLIGKYEYAYVSVLYHHPSRRVNFNALYLTYQEMTQAFFFTRIRHNSFSVLLYAYMRQILTRSSAANVQKYVHYERVYLRAGNIFPNEAQSSARE